MVALGDRKDLVGQKRVCLIQPQHSWRRGYIYLPGSLLNLGSRLLAAGFAVEFLDLNIHSLDDGRTRAIVQASDFVGVNALGSPYIPEIYDLIVELRRQGYKKPILVGGEGVARLTKNDFRTFFPQHEVGDVRHVIDNGDLEEAFGLLLRRLPPKYEVSMRPMLELLPAWLQEQYLTNEWCLFLSHGCAFGCDYCNAAKRERERYRTFEGLRDEVGYIAKFLASRGYRDIRVHASNLDALQNAESFESMLRVAHETARAHGVQLHVRALATTKLTARAHERDPNLLNRLRFLGLYTLAFGVDGVSEAIWQEQRKLHNSITEYETSRNACQAASIKVEAFMVVGFPTETATESVGNILWSARETYLRGVVVRPYLAKMNVPGGKIWAEDHAERARLLADREAFRDFDYAMFASAATRPDLRERLAANAAFGGLLGVLAPAGLSTWPLLPPSGSRLQQRVARFVNRWMPPDR